MVEMAAISSWSYNLWPWHLADCQKAREGIVFLFLYIIACGNSRICSSESI